MKNNSLFCHRQSLARLSMVYIIIGLCFLCVLTACDAPAANQNTTTTPSSSASPTMAQLKTTPALTPTLAPMTPTPVTTMPPATGNMTFVYDDNTGYVLLLCDRFYEGNNNSQSETWIWDGKNWAQLHPVHAPSIRSLVPIAYDPALKQVVLFGGLGKQGNGGMLADTWTWDGTDWTQQHPTTSPPARDDAALAFDTATNQLVLFGGGGNGPRIGGLVPPPLNDTWVWDGTNWTQQHPATSPLTVLSPALAYDAARQKLMLFGGTYADTTPVRKELNDTWEWTGTNWVQLHPQSSPSLFENSNGQKILYSYPHMVYDPQSQHIFLLFGGDDPNNNTGLQTSWEWDGANWTKTSVGGPPNGSDQGTLIYDAKMQAVLEVTVVEQPTSTSFDTTLWKWNEQSWINVQEWGKAPQG